MLLQIRMIMMNDNMLYICGRDIVLIESSESLTIKNTGKNLLIKNLGLLFFILPVLGAIALLVSVIIMLLTVRLHEVTALPALLLVIFIPCLIIAIKMFLWMQALLAGFRLTFCENQVSGRWGIIPIKAKFNHASRIVLYISHMRGTWGCGGEIIFSRIKFLSISIFNPYAIFFHKNDAIDELIKISDFMKRKSCISIPIEMNLGK